MKKVMNHSEYMESLKTKSTASLRYIAQDANNAMTAMPDGVNAGYYADEVHYCMMEIRSRMTFPMMKES